MRTIITILITLVALQACQKETQETALLSVEPVDHSINIDDPLTALNKLNLPVNPEPSSSKGENWLDVAWFTVGDTDHVYVRSDDYVGAETCYAFVDETLVSYTLVNSTELLLESSTSSLTYDVEEDLYNNVFATSYNNLYDLNSAGVIVSPNSNVAALELDGDCLLGGLINQGQDVLGDDDDGDGSVTITVSGTLEQNIIAENTITFSAFYGPDLLSDPTFDTWSFQSKSTLDAFNYNLWIDQNFSDNETKYDLNAGDSVTRYLYQTTYLEQTVVIELHIKDNEVYTLHIAYPASGLSDEINMGTYWIEAYGVLSQPLSAVFNTLKTHYAYEYYYTSFERVRIRWNDCDAQENHTQPYPVIRIEETVDLFGTTWTFVKSESSDHFFWDGTNTLIISAPKRQQCVYNEPGSNGNASYTGEQVVGIWVSQDSAQFRFNGNETPFSIQNHPDYVQSLVDLKTYIQELQQ